MYRTLEVSVVVGKVVPTILYPPEVVVHDKVCAVPLSLMRIINFCASIVVPDGALIVAPTASAVTSYCVKLEFGVMLAALVIEVAA